MKVQAEFCRILDNGDTVDVVGSYVFDFNNKKERGVFAKRAEDALRGGLSVPLPEGVDFQGVSR